MQAKSRSYNVRGRLINLEKMRSLIVETIGDRTLTIEELSKDMGMERRKVQYVLLNMKNLGMLNCVKDGKLFKYFKPYAHPLQMIFHPMPDFSDRIKGIYIHTEEEANAHR
ncbi:hypothetical protein EBR37_00730 [bacterium]|jgi:hypothetical protein|nr:hypothetical protein [bacterium]